MRTVRLPLNLRQYLVGADFLSADLLSELDSQLSDPSPYETTLTLDDDLAERFRETFTHRLAEVGFDASYELSPEGVVLEELIDRFAAQP